MRLIIAITTLAILLTNGCASPTLSMKLKQPQSLIESHKYDEAKAAINSLIQEYPATPEPHYLMGSLNFILTNYYECLSDFDKALRYGFEENQDFHLQRGVALFNTGNSEDAENSFQLSMNYAPSAMAQKYLGIIQYESGDYAAAATSLSEASTQFTNDATVQLFLGISLFKEGRNSEALDVFRQALTTNPKNDELLFHAASLCMLSGFNEESLRYFESVSQASPLYEKSMYNRAEAYINVGDFKNATDILIQYTDTHTDDFNALFNLSGTLIKTGDYLAAIDILETLNQKDSSDIRVIYNLGLAYHLLSVTDQSLRFLSSAAALDPENIDYLYAYAITLGENGDTKKAAIQMNDILILDPFNLDANEWLRRHTIKAEIKTEVEILDN